MTQEHNERNGRWAEWLAALWLVLRGYQILARRWRSPLGEIDLVARQGGTLVIVEVKARRSRAEALAAIQPRQQQRLLRAGQLYAQRATFIPETIRMDAVLLAPGHWPLHVRNAFDNSGQ